MSLDDVAPDVDFEKEMPEEVVADVPNLSTTVAEVSTPEPEPAPTPVVETPKQPEVVPLKTYLDEKAERRELQRRIAELEAARAKPPEPVVEDVPSFDDNPAGHLLAQQRQIASNNQKLEQELAQYRQAQE